MAQLAPGPALPAGEVAGLRQLLLIGPPDADSPPVQLQLEVRAAARARFQARLEAVLHVRLGQKLAEDLRLRKRQRRQGPDEVLLDLLELRRGGLVGLQAQTHALGGRVVEGGRVPDDLLPLRRLPHRRTAVPAQGDVLAALRVDRQIAELNRRLAGGLLLRLHAAPFLCNIKKDAVARVGGRRLVAFVVALGKP